MIRLAHAISCLLVIALGLASRRYASSLPPFVATYAGDTLWATMAYLGLSAIVPRQSLTARGVAALGLAYAIEVSQFYHAPWIDSIRAKKLGGLVLGFGFLVSDLVCYTVGVFIAVGGEAVVARKRGISESPTDHV